MPLEGETAITCNNNYLPEFFLTLIYFERCTCVSRMPLCFCAIFAEYLCFFKLFYLIPAFSWHL